MINYTVSAYIYKCVVVWLMYSGSIFEVNLKKICKKKMSEPVHLFVDFIFFIEVYIFFFLLLKQFQTWKGSLYEKVTLDQIFDT